MSLNIPFKYAKPFFHALEPEIAHQVTMEALKRGLSPHIPAVKDDKLKVKLWDINFRNPIGLAAGFDKNAEVISPILDMGFGFAEVGTVTPEPQEGNPRRRVFRNVKHQAVINRMGFPNKGVHTFKQNVRLFNKNKNRPNGIVGLNIGMNKDQTNPVNDYTYLIKHLGSLADYYTINISSPNTPGLRNLQDHTHLLPLIDSIQQARKIHCNPDNPPPILVKLAPDLNMLQQQELAQTVLESGVDGLILTNTTLARPDFLPPKFRKQKGGLSGAPLKDKSTEIIGNFYKMTKGKIPIIGAGGVSSGADAYDKIKAGASLIQLYSALIFQGPELINQINNDLIKLLEQDNHDNILNAVGTAHKQN